MESVKKLRSALLDVIKEIPFLSVLLPFTTALVFLYPILELLSLIIDSFSFGVVYRLIYDLFLLGLVLAFAKEDHLSLTIGLGLNCICRIIILFTTFSFNNLFYLLVYGVFFLLAMLAFSKTDKYKKLRASMETISTQAKAAVEEHTAPNSNEYERTITPEKLCTECGTAMLLSEKFCPKCGTKNETLVEIKSELSLDVPVPEVVVAEVIEETPFQEEVAVPAAETAPVTELQTTAASIEPEPPVADEEVAEDDPIEIHTIEEEEQSMSEAAAPPIEESIENVAEMADAPVETPQEPAPTKMFCIYCGAQLLPGAKFCIKCGKEL